MIVEQELQRVFSTLLHNKSAQIAIGGSDIHVQVTSDATHLTLTTPVYTGGNYIPTSVRNCIKQVPPFSSTLIHTQLIVVEEKFEILMRFQEEIQGLDTNKLRFILEEFAWVADEWRFFLDEQDRNDRIHVRVS